MSVDHLSCLMLVIILFAPYSTQGYSQSQLSNTYQIPLYGHFPGNEALTPREIYSNVDRRSPQAAQKPSGASMSSVPQRPRNETAGTQEVKSQRRQKPLRASSTSSSQAVVNLELVVSITFYGIHEEN
jgi:hypothetical protein